MATINKEQMEKALPMLYETLDELFQEGIISRELKEGGDPENPDDWLYYMDDRQRGHIRDARLSPTQSS